jgi:hypothetical protein
MCRGREATWKRGLTLQKQTVRPREGNYLEKGFNIAKTNNEGGKLLGEGV